MAALADLISWRDALQAARYSGARRVVYGGKETEFKSDAEMAAALAALDRQIAAAGTAPRASFIRVSSSKGI
ncbi:phage head-tail joining protein [Azospirillum lipoferum]|uniref:GpW protein n=1 Tax=Azospirillum lipoferum (strain 4B) TaxID=862719 RepID=G7ZBY7_AZOL4|nr:hypothetical protein [Azospirillum lipoferum]CBS88989.1 Conserved protein of unknown function [Azospirillum lipoferum 4B]